MSLDVYPKEIYQKDSSWPVVANRYCSGGARRGMRTLRTPAQFNQGHT